MADVIQTGNTSTITFGTSGWAGAVRLITHEEMTRESLDASDLSTLVHRKKVPGDLTDAAGFGLEFIWNANDSLQIPPIDGVVELITITHPKGSFSTAATEAGNGFVKGWTPPTLSNDDLMVAQASIEWQGGSATEPSFSDAVA